MCVPSYTLCPALKDCKWRYLVFHRKRLEQRVWPCQRHRKCHYVSFVMYISDVMFEEHCSNISGDMLHRVLYCFRGTTYDVITPHLHNTKT